MKRFLWILLGGFAVFLAVSVVQEWEVFSQPWFPAEDAPAVAEVEPGTRAAIEATLRELHALSDHVYRSEGDPRFLERLPASEGVREELAREVAYLSANGRVQQVTLLGLELVEIEETGEDAWRVLAKEYLVVRLTRRADGTQDGPSRSQVGWVEYRISGGPGGLRVESWRPVPAPPGAAP